jgi:hypothetical protein
VGLFHQEHRTGSFDLASDFTMEMGWHTRNPARKNLAAFRHKLFQEVRVFVIERFGRDIDSAARHDAISAPEIRSAFGVFRFHLGYLTSR